MVALIDEGKDEFLSERRYRGRIRAFVPAVLGTTRTTTWARPCFALAGGVPPDPTRKLDDFGVFYMPRPGDLVWVEFEQGDVRKPIWTGFLYPKADPDAKVAGVPRLARGKDDGTLSVPRLAPSHTYAVGATGTGADFVKVETGDPSVGISPDIQPGNAFAGKYPYVMLLKTRAGHTIILDDTKGSAGIWIRHRLGTQLQLRPDGSLRIFCPKQVHVVSDGKMILKSPVVELGAGDLLGASAGCMTGRTQPVCQVTGLPLGFSRSVRANS